MTRLLVTTHGPDQPGIVAAVTTVLASHGYNLEDTSMTRLGGHFTMLLLVSTPGDVDKSEAEALFDGLVGFSQLSLYVGYADEPEVNSVALPDGERWAVSLYGADQQGIVSTVTSYLAEVGANIEDLSTRLSGESTTPVYTMLFDITVPQSVEGGDVATELDRRAAALGITCHARPVDVDTF